MKKLSSLLFVLLLMFASFTAGMEYPRGDVDQDGKVGIGDVTCLVDYLLTGTWDEPAPEQPTDETFTVNGVTFNMIAIEGGTFMMGATAEQEGDNYTGEKPVHEVTVSSFSLGETEVTQELWIAVMGDNPSSFSSSNTYPEDLQRPVDRVSWDDCQTFITELNQLTGKNFRLPTEAEWEYAARGGNKSQGYKYAGGNTLTNVAWYWDNIPSHTWHTAGYGTQTVATKAPNELGLYDMSGNVYEWCQDWYGNYSSVAQTNPTGPESGDERVSRGGCWFSLAALCRVSYRYGYTQSNISYYQGLRLAM